MSRLLVHNRVSCKAPSTSRWSGLEAGQVEGETRLSPFNSAFHARTTSEKSKGALVLLQSAGRVTRRVESDQKSEALGQDLLELLGEGLRGKTRRERVSERATLEKRSRKLTPAEAGFWPVMRFPSTTTLTPQSLTRSRIPPSLTSSVSSRKGTSPSPLTAASSELVKPAKCLPLMMCSPFERTTFLKIYRQQERDQVSNGLRL